MRSSIIGVFTALAITIASVYYRTPNYIIYLNLMSLLIVLGGTFSASGMSASFGLGKKF